MPGYLLDTTDRRAREVRLETRGPDLGNSPAQMLFTVSANAFHALASWLLKDWRFIASTMYTVALLLEALLQDSRTYQGLTWTDF